MVLSSLILPKFVFWTEHLILKKLVISFLVISLSYQTLLKSNPMLMNTIILHLLKIIQGSDPSGTRAIAHLLFKRIFSFKWAILVR